MRLIFKLLAFPFVLVTGLLIIAFSLFVASLLVQNFRGRLAARAIFFLPVIIASGAVLGILSGIVFLASLVLFFTAGVWAGLAWLVIAFLISPYGLPMAAAWLVGMIGGANHALKDFVFG